MCPLHVPEVVARVDVVSDHTADRRGKVRAERVGGTDLPSSHPDTTISVKPMQRGLAPEG
jgi:hypothetical protein